MKRFLAKTMCIVFILCLSACGSTTNNQSGTTFPEPVDSVEQTKNEDMSNADILDKEFVDSEANTASGEESEMKLFINDVEVPVIWEENDSVAELMEEASKGDIVLYNSSNIVLFYGSNTWAYTKLGKMNLSEQELIDLLSNGNVKIKISR